MARIDPHSYFDSQHARIDSLDWQARVDFPAKTLDCEVTLRFAEPARTAVDLDTRDLDIRSVQNDRQEPLEFELSKPEGFMGSRLRVKLPVPVRSLKIRYQTSVASSA